MRKGTRYGTLVIRIPVIVEEVANEGYLDHLNEHYTESTVKGIINWAASRTIGDALFLSKQATWHMERP